MMEWTWARNAIIEVHRSFPLGVFCPIGELAVPMGLTGELS